MSLKRARYASSPAAVSGIPSIRFDRRPARNGATYSDVSTKERYESFYRDLVGDTVRFLKGTIVRLGG